MFVNEVFTEHSSGCVEIAFVTAVRSKLWQRTDIHSCAMSFRFFFFICIYKLPVLRLFHFVGVQGSWTADDQTR